jgi:alpha-glucosidase (family GH31 glycosyl hydrolase)
MEHYVGEGPYQPREYQFLEGTVPPWGVRNRPDATYYPIPWVLSTRGYGPLVERDEVSYGRFRTEAEDRWSIEVEEGTLAYTVFAGPDPLDALARFTARTGRQPAQRGSDNGTSDCFGRQGHKERRRLPRTGIERRPPTSKWARRDLNPHILSDTGT